MRQFVRKFDTGGSTRRNVFAAELAITGSCSALPPRVCLKYAAGVEAVAALRREELLYRHELAELAGVAVPQTHGFFTGGTMVAPIACLIMELCMSTEMLKSPDEFWCVMVFARPSEFQVYLISSLWLGWQSSGDVDTVQGPCSRSDAQYAARPAPFRHEGKAGLPCRLLGRVDTPVRERTPCPVQRRP